MAPSAYARVELAGVLQDFQFTNGKLVANPTLGHFSVLEVSFGDVAADVHARARFDPARHKMRLASALSFVADPESFAPLVGAYSSVPPGGPALVVSRSGDGLAIAVGKEMTLELVPFEKDGFLVNSRPMVGRAFKFRTAADLTTVILAEDQPIGVKSGR